MRYYTSMRRNNQGALEGLPLYMIILIVIAAVAVAVVMGWMKSAQTQELSHIDVEIYEGSISDGKKLSELKMEEGKTYAVRVYAYDSKNNLMKDVKVVLDGCTEHEVELTDSSGKVTFTGITPHLGGAADGEITITATYTGNIQMIAKKTILVV